MEAENQFNLGRASEITRDEMKFQKFVNRLRTRFTILFDNLLEVQLVLKGVTTREEWKEIKNDIYYEFAEDNHFAELKYSELMRERLSLLRDIDEYTGRYFSQEYIRKYVLRQSEAEIAQMAKEMEASGGGEDEDDLDF
jgi:hypothetical protein